MPSLRTLAMLLALLLVPAFTPSSAALLIDVQPFELDMGTWNGNGVSRAAAMGHSGIGVARTAGGTETYAWQELPVNTGGTFTVWFFDDLSDVLPVEQKLQYAQVWGADGALGVGADTVASPLTYVVRDGDQHFATAAPRTFGWVAWSITWDNVAGTAVVSVNGVPAYATTSFGARGENAGFGNFWSEPQHAQDYDDAVLAIL